MEKKEKEERRLARRDFTWEEDVWLNWNDTAGIVLVQ